MALETTSDIKLLALELHHGFCNWGFCQVELNLRSTQPFPHVGYVAIKAEIDPKYTQLIEGPDGMQRFIQHQGPQRHGWLNAVAASGDGRKRRRWGQEGPILEQRDIWKGGQGLGGWLENSQRAHRGTNQCASQKQGQRAVLETQSYPTPKADRAFAGPSVARKMVHEMGGRWTSG